MCVYLCTCSQDPFYEKALRGIEHVQSLNSSELEDASGSFELAQEDDSEDVLVTLGGGGGEGGEGGGGGSQEVGLCTHCSTRCMSAAFSSSSTCVICPFDLCLQLCYCLCCPLRYCANTLHACCVEFELVLPL